jgi:tetratricopeptide (TPR) repeat protein
MKKKKSKKKQNKSKKIISPQLPPEPSPARPAMPGWLPLFLPVLLCLIVYYNSLSNGFVYDDYGVIVENKYISQPGGLLASLFSQSYYEFAGIEASYRPVSTLSYYVIYAFAELNPFYYHLVSLLLHMLNTILVSWLAVLVLQHHLRALIAGLLFACHPVLTEAVNGIDWNDDLLTTLFFLLALICYIRNQSENLVSGIKGYSLSLLFFALGLLAKEMAITLPAIILLYDLVLRDADRDSANFTGLQKMVRNRIPVYAGYMAVSLIYLGVRFFILYNPREFHTTSAGSLLERIIYLPGHLFSYIRLTLFPVNLNADYLYSHPGSFFEAWNLAGLVIVLALVGFTFKRYRNSKLIFFGIGWFLITLVPVYNLVEIYHPLAERYLYLPTIGFCLVLAAAVHAAAKKYFSYPSTVNAAILIPVVVILSLYSAATIMRNSVWQNNFTLWSKTVQKSPNSLAARGGLGMAYLTKGMLDEAAEQFEIAIKLYPRHHKNYYNLGLVHHQKGELNKALEYFSRSVALNPTSAKGHYNLATVYLQQRAWDLAIRHYVKVNELDPAKVMAHYNLGMAYAMQEKLDSAVSAWEKVLQLEPQHTMAKNNIQKAQKMMNRTGGEN